MPEKPFSTTLYLMTIEKTGMDDRIATGGNRYLQRLGRCQKWTHMNSGNRSNLKDFLWRNQYICAKATRACTKSVSKESTSFGCQKKALLTVHFVA